ncbi:MAG TPA: hypothetical protein VHO46_10365 [Bacteroidales bacterium]|nr:hypothetical protein [Bacteroidales bacterium]
MNEKQLEIIKDKIKVYRSRLASEKRRFGGYFDNSGIRYIIPELYLKLGDYKGAIAYFRWFSREFPNDIGLPFFNLFWSFTFFKNKRGKDAIRLAYKTAFQNTYLLDLICNRPVECIDKLEIWGHESVGYAKEVAEWCNKLLTNDFRTWISGLIETGEFSTNMSRFISLQKLLKDETAVKLRSKLLAEISLFEKQLTERDDD